MRNLKRVLSLALASAMLLGMMVMGAGAADKKAADLTDMDKVKNKEAVSLLVDLGIIAGKDDGTYAPTETVDRATMAKLVYYVLEGDASADVYKGSAALKDVKGHWAEGFINYSYSLGIIAGDGTGNFLPAVKVSTVGAAKMMLVALGYDAADRGYVNDPQWSVNIMKDANANGLLKGISQKANDELTRDNAALMIFNTLFAKTRTPEYDRDMGEKYIKSYTVNPTTLGMETYNLVKYNITVNGLTDVTANSVSPKPATAITNADKTAVEKAILDKDTGLKLTASMIGTNLAVYAKADYELTSDSKNIDTIKFSKMISTTAGTADTTVLGTSMNGTAITGYTDGVATPTKDLTTKATKNKGFIAELNENANGDVSVISILNGEVKDSANVVHSTLTTAAQKKGAIVELIDTGDDGIADIVKVTEKSVVTLTADVTTRTSDGELQVKVPGVPNLSAWTDAKNVVGYEDLKKGDVVLYYRTSDGASTPTYAYTIEKAEYVEGKVSATKGTGTSTEIKVDGTFYAASGLVSNVLSSWSDTTNTYKFYLDNNGTIVKADKVTNEAADEFAILLSTGWAGNANELGGTSYGQAKLLYSDGTTEIVKLAKIGSTVADSTNTTDTTFDAVKGTFVKYVLNDDDKYELTSATQSNVSGKVTNNSKVFNGTLIGDANTVFVVASKDGTKTVYKTYTGIASVPTMTGITGKALIEKNIATVVYVDATGSSSAIEGIDSDAVYAYVPKISSVVEYAKNGDTPKYYEYTAYVDGTKTTIQTSALLGTDNAIYKLTTKNTSGHYAAPTATTAVFGMGHADFKTGIEIASNGTLKVTGVTDPYGYDDSTKIYVINADKELTAIAASELAADSTNKIMVLADSNKNANIIFVQDLVGTTTTATVKVSVDGGAETTVANGGKVIAADGKSVKVTATATNDATCTIDNASFTMGTSAVTVTVTVTTEDGNTTSTVVFTVANS